PGVVLGQLAGGGLRGDHPAFAAVAELTAEGHHGLRWPCGRRRRPPISSRPPTWCWTAPRGCSTSSAGSQPDASDAALGGEQAAVDCGLECGVVAFGLVRVAPGKHAERAVR